MSRYTSLPAERSHAGEVKQPKFCEVTGCATMWVPHVHENTVNGKQAAHYTCGQAVTVVNDRFGVKRGICADHYLKGLVAAGGAPNQDLLDSDGRYDHTKVLRHWATMDQSKPSMPLLPPAPPMSKGLADVLGELSIPKTASDEPSWLWEHP
jgi:hypothetical protein